MIKQPNNKVKKYGPGIIHKLKDLANFDPIKDLAWQIVNMGLTEDELIKVIGNAPSTIPHTLINRLHNEFRDIIKKTKR